MRRRTSVWTLPAYSVYRAASCGIVRHVAAKRRNMPHPSCVNAPLEFRVTNINRTNSVHFLFQLNVLNSCYPIFNTFWHTKQVYIDRHAIKFMSRNLKRRCMMFFLFLFVYTPSYSPSIKLCVYFVAFEKCCEFFFKNRKFFSFMYIWRPLSVIPSELHHM